MGPTEKLLDAQKCALLVVSLLSDDPLSITSPRNLRYDCEAVVSRVKHEGLEFLTKTLPKLGKAVLAGLKDDVFPHIRGFNLRTCGRPAFMQEYLDCIFSDCDDPDRRALALKHVLQVTFVFYKAVLPFKADDKLNAYKKFIQTELDIQGFTVADRPAVKVAARLVSRVFEGFDPFDIRPHHGPGSVATGEKLTNKWRFKRIYQSVHSVYPFASYHMVNASIEEAEDREEWYNTLLRLNEPRGKLIAVPKDSRGPRLISEEPLELQYLQQGLKDAIYARLENHPLTRGHINFACQTVNRELALRSSKDGSHATLDLKDASDRVTCALVSRIFQDCPEVNKALFALRSTSTQIKDSDLGFRKILPFSKYAPMGSALCFPVLSVVVWGLAVGAIRAANVPLDEALNSVYVYGDDIIVATKYTDIVVEELQQNALVVNEDKSYSTGRFRESCGMDAYNGVQVTPTRLKYPPAKYPTASAFEASVAAVNSLENSGYARGAEYLLRWTESVFGVVPYGPPESAFPCLITDVKSARWLNLLLGVPMRWDPDISGWRILVLHVKSKTKGVADWGDWERLLEDLLQPPRDSDKRDVRGTARLIRRWIRCVT